MPYNGAVNTPPRIIQLDEVTINRIAAGEVVERPASVVKELVENSLDAGARSVSVYVEDGGKRLVRVVDDGSGMTAEEATLSLQRHATSKIVQADDLFNVTTLGFRGEGLPSIASVSRLELLTRRPDADFGFGVIVEGGTIASAEQSAAALGTAVTVLDLFFNTPARLRFMKSTATELAHIVDLVSKYALAYPDVSFRLMNAGQSLIVSPGGGDETGAVAAVWGKDVARALASLDSVHAGVRVTGFISPPHLTRQSRDYQAFFVNSRPVRSRLLFGALDEAYRSLTPEKRFPIASLKLEIAPDHIDVNVHPAKTEVKFQREGDVFEAINAAVRDGLYAHGMIPEAFRSVPRPYSRTWLPAPGPSGHHVSSAIQGFRPQSEGGEVASSTWAQPPEMTDSLDAPNADTAVPSLEPPPVGSHATPFADLLDGLRIIGQARRTYVVCETARGVVLVDQHVAHERVLYERFCGMKGDEPVERQHLLTPFSITFDRRAAVLLSERIDEVARLGFDLEAFGQDAYLVRAVPAALGTRDCEAILRDMIDELVESAVTRRLVPAREQIWITAACKQAVKSGDPLSVAEMETLIQQLAETQNPYLCPHGRPITITLTNEEIDRKFKRT